MKLKLIFILFILYLAPLVWSQTAAVTGTATDSDGQIWQNGTWGYEFYPAPAYPNLNSYYINGVPLTTYYTGPVNGSLDVAGHFNATGIPRSDQITPVGSQWRFKICPRATAECGSFITPIATALTDLTTQINANITAPRFTALANAFGYNDGETIIKQPFGATYWNVIMLCQRYYDGTTWACNGSGGGGGTPGTLGLTTFGVNGPSTYNNVSNVINVPNYGGLIGYTPSSGGGLVLNVDSGVSFCLGVKNSYSSGTVGLVNNTTNYVYLATATCNVTVNQTGYPTNTFPIATVITSAGSISSIADDRTPFNSFNTGGGGGGGSTIIQVEGIATTPATPVNYTVSGATPPAGNFNINFQQQPGTAKITGYIPNYPTSLPGSFQMNPVLPIAGTYDIVYPTSFVISDPSSTGTTADNKSAKLPYPAHGSGFVTQPGVTWSFTLPSTIIAGSITSIYGATNWSGSGHVPGPGYSSHDIFIGCGQTGGLANFFFLDTAAGPYPSQNSSLLLSGSNGSNFNTIQCNAGMFGCTGVTCTGDTLYVNQIYLIVYHTGATNLSNALNVWSPLIYTSATNSLSLDPAFPSGLMPISATKLPVTTTLTVPQAFFVTDATSASDCSTTGGGTHTHWCFGSYNVPYVASGESTPSPLTTKGDIYLRSASADSRLPVGPDGQTIVADSTQALGVKWTASAAAGVSSIDAQTGAFSFAGAGVSHVGNAYTFSGGGGGGGGSSTLPLSCQPGFGDGLNAITAGTYLVTTCKNTSGSTWTLTGIQCNTDNNGTSTMNVTNGAGTGLLTGAVTCTNSYAAGTQSGTTTIANGDLLKFTFVADGTSKQGSFAIFGTIPVTVSGGGGSSDWTNLASSLTCSGCTIVGKNIVPNASVTTFTVSGIPQNYTDLHLTALAQTTNAALQNIQLQFNGDVASNYQFQYAGTGGSGASTTFDWLGLASPTSATNIFNSGVADILQYTNTSIYKTSSVTASIISQPGAYVIANVWRSTAAINSMTISLGAGNFGTNSVFTLSGEGCTSSCGGSGAVSLITQTVLSSPASSFTFSSIPGTYADLIVRCVGRGSAAATGVAANVTLNGDTGANYDYMTTQTNNVVQSTNGFGITAVPLQFPGSTATANYSGHFEFTIQEYAGTTFFKEANFTQNMLQSATANTTYTFSGGFWWRNTAAITNITITAGSGNFITGSRCSLYGSL